MARTIDSPRQKALRDFLVEKRKEAGLRQVDLAKRLKRRHDWPGIAIANNVIAKYGAMPWHFSAADYAAAAESAPEFAAPLSGQPVIASWDANLTAAMTKTGIKIEEEAIAKRIIELLGKEHIHF